MHSQREQKSLKEIRTKFIWFGIEFSLLARIVSGVLFWYDSQNPDSYLRPQVLPKTVGLIIFFLALAIIVLFSLLFKKSLLKQLSIPIIIMLVLAVFYILFFALMDFQIIFIIIGIVFGVVVEILLIIYIILSIQNPVTHILDYTKAIANKCTRTPSHV